MQDNFFLPPITLARSSVDNSYDYSGFSSFSKTSFKSSEHLSLRYPTRLRSVDDGREWSFAPETAKYTLCGSESSSSKSTPKTSVRSTPARLSSISISSNSDSGLEEGLDHVNTIKAKKLLHQITSHERSIYEKEGGQFLYTKIKDSGRHSKKDSPEYKLRTKVNEIKAASAELFEILDSRDIERYELKFKNLIENGTADVSAIDNNATLVTEAVRANICNNFKHLNILEYLLKAGANNMVTISYNVLVVNTITSSMHAMEEDYNMAGHKKMIDLLIEYGVVGVVNVVNMRNKFPDEFWEQYKDEFLSNTTDETAVLAGVHHIGLESASDIQ